MAIIPLLRTLIPGALLIRYEQVLDDAVHANRCVGQRAPIDVECRHCAPSYVCDRCSSVEDKVSADHLVLMRHRQREHHTLVFAIQLAFCWPNRVAVGWCGQVIDAHPMRKRLGENVWENVGREHDCRPSARTVGRGPK